MECQGWGRNNGVNFGFIFVAVKQCPNELVETLQNHSMERGKVVQKFQEKSNQIVKQVDELFDLQKQTVS